MASQQSSGTVAAAPATTVSDKLSSMAELSQSLQRLSDLDLLQAILVPKTSLAPNVLVDCWEGLRAGSAGYG